MSIARTLRCRLILLQFMKLQLGADLHVFTAGFRILDSEAELNAIIVASQLSDRDFESHNVVSKEAGLSVKSIIWSTLNSK